MPNISDEYDPTADPADMRPDGFYDLTDGDLIDPDELFESHELHPSLSPFQRNNNFKGWPFEP